MGSSNNLNEWKLEIEAPLIVHLKKWDTCIDKVDPNRRSLNPQREKATRFIEFKTQIEKSLPGPLLNTFLSGVEKMIQAMINNFPENIFWDFDFLIHQVLEIAKAHSTDKARKEIDLTFTMIAQLQPIYGIHSVVHFRYTHDFLYGFDWAKWVRKNPEARSKTGPFDLLFLEASLKRGHELLELIAANDSKYPQLKDKQSRNPFPFSREPKDEILLFSELAKNDLIPVESWNALGKTNHQLDFQTRRKEKAQQLGLGSKK